MPQDRAWTADPSPRDAWAASVALTAPGAEQIVACVDDDNRWGWAHLDLPVDESAPRVAEEAGRRRPPRSTPPRHVVWDTLMGRQRGACAMCSITMHSGGTCIASRSPRPDLCPGRRRS